jgi:hypothetical protein
MQTPYNYIVMVLKRLINPQFLAVQPYKFSMFFKTLPEISVKL